MTADKIVTHEDLDILVEIRSDYPDDFADEGDVRVANLLDRLIAAAEADAPPLPEGWYWWKGDMATTVVYLIGKILYRWDDGDAYFGTVDGINRDRLTPLRPTVTEADIEKAAIAYMSNGEDTEWQPDDSNSIKKHARYVARLMFAAAGIEVSDQ